MNKESTAWLIVRLLGLISVAIGLFQLYGFVVNLSYVLAQLSSSVPAEGTLRLVNLRWDPFFGFVFWGVLSIYFLKFGATVHELLIKEGRKGENS